MRVSIKLRDRGSSNLIFAFTVKIVDQAGLSLDQSDDIHTVGVYNTKEHFKPIKFNMILNIPSSWKTLPIAKKAQKVDADFAEL